MASSALKYTSKLRSQRVLVLGGSSGIGYAVAEAALEHGCAVTISSSNQARVDKAVGRLQAHAAAAGIQNANVAGKTCDMASRDKAESNLTDLLDFATRDGKLDHVVYTAGDSLRIQPITEVTAELVERTTAVRLLGPMLVAKHLAKYITPSVRSSFTLTTGTMAWRPSPGWSVTAAVAGGIEPLTRGLAIDLKPVRVNCVLVGAVRTELFDSIPAEKLEDVMASFRRDCITGTMGTPEDLAEAYLYSMKNTFVTAASINSDGGRLVGDSKGEDANV